MIDRRSLIGCGLAAMAVPVSAARLAPPDREVKAGAIHWSVGPGPDLHGFMAIPAKARGKQPAVLLIGGAGTPGETLRALAIAAAQAGFVACAPTLPGDAAGSVVPLRGTARWLAGNRYATGKVAAIGLDAAAPLAVALAREGDATAAVALGDAVAAPSALILGRTPDGRWLAPPDPAPLDWNVAWARVTSFLRERLT